MDTPPIYVGLSPDELRQVADWMLQAFLAGFGGAVVAGLLSRVLRR